MLPALCRGIYKGYLPRSFGLSPMWRNRSRVKTREIVYLSMEELRFFFVPLLKSLDRTDMSQSTLWDVMVVGVHVTGQGIGQVLPGAEAGGGGHLGDALVEALHPAVSLGTAGLDEAALNGMLGTSPIESGGGPSAPARRWRRIGR
jgi:hypothetical protein